MERDRISQYPHQHCDLGSPNLNSLGRHHPDLKHHRNNFAANMVIPNDTMPASGFSNEPHGWFYGLPRFRQAFTPLPNPIFKEKLNVGSLVSSHELAIPNSGHDCAKKSFLVFDQTGDRTTLIFSSGIGAPMKFPTSLSAKQLTAEQAVPMFGNKPGPKNEPVNNSDQILMDELNEESEMHEDTEELNALLYSDDDDSYYSDDEVTSKDLTPSTLTFHNNQELLEHVASSDEPCSNIPCPAKRKRSQSFDYEDDAQSSCANAKYPCSDEMGSLWNNKRSKREKIQETVSILRRIIPSAEGKNATDVLDEAISYLKSLKLKVESLGLDNL